MPLVSNSVGSSYESQAAVAQSRGTGYSASGNVSQLRGSWYAAAGFVIEQRMTSYEAISRGLFHTAAHPYASGKAVTKQKPSPYEFLIAVENEDTPNGGNAGYGGSGYGSGGYGT